MTETTHEAAAMAWVALARAHRVAMNLVEARLKEEELPPLSWYDALWELEKAGEEGLRPFELEKALLFEQYNLSRLSDRLSKAGVIERCVCPGDRRGQVLRITGEGQALRRRMWEVYSKAIDEAVGCHLSADEAGQLSALLGKLSHGSDR